MLKPTRREEVARGRRGRWVSLLLGGGLLGGLAWAWRAALPRGPPLAGLGLPGRLAPEPLRPTALGAWEPLVQTQAWVDVARALGGDWPGSAPSGLPWHPVGALVAVWDADLKVTEADPAGEDTTCPGGTGPWPTATVLDGAGWTGPGAADWSLNDAARTLALMDLNGMQLYLHDARAGGAVGYFNHTDFACDWLSFAALNDAIGMRGPGAAARYTGLVLGNVEPDLIFARAPGPSGALVDLHPAALGAGLEACYYRDWLARARTEAQRHPHVKLVIVDELTQSLASPFEIWGGHAARWTVEDVALLATLAHEADPTAAPSAGGPGGARLRCDAAWRAVEALGMRPAPGVPAASAGSERPVELWARVNAASVPLFLVPSLMLGVPAERTPGEQQGEGLPVGGALVARWDLPAAATAEAGAAGPQDDSPPASIGRVHLRYFATTLTAGQPITLLAVVNGVEQPSSALRVLAPGTGTAAELRDQPAVHNIYMVDLPVSTPVGDPRAPAPGAEEGTPGGDLVLGAPNGVELRLRADGPTADWTDRAFVITDLRLIVEDENGALVREVELRPADAVGLALDAAGVEAPCRAPQVCRDNAALRADGPLDGLTIAHDIRAEWPSTPFSGSVAPLDQAWSRFIAYACGSFARSAPDGQRRRCLVDERAWVSEGALLSRLDMESSNQRLLSGLSGADGAVVLWLTLEVEDMFNFMAEGASASLGRFSARDPLDPAYPYLAYLPRLTRNMLGEGIVWEVQADPADAACRGEWRVEWAMPGCPAKWTYGPVGEVWAPERGAWAPAFFNPDVERIEPEEALAFYQLIEDQEGVTCAQAADTPAGGAFLVRVPEAAEGLFRFGWQIKDDADRWLETDGRVDVGDSRDVPQYVEMRLQAPLGCGAADYAVTQTAVVDPTLLDYYASVTALLDAWAGRPGGGAGGSASR